MSGGPAVSRPRRGAEAGAVAGTIEDAGRGKTVEPEGREEGRGPPLPVRHDALDPVPARRHVGRGPGLIDEDEALGAQLGLTLLPGVARFGGLGAILLDCPLRPCFA
jgi:hypothetical protein